MFWILERPLVVDINIVYGTLNIDPNANVWETKKCESCQRTRVIRQNNDLSLDLYGMELQNFVWIDDAQIIVDEVLADLIEKSSITGLNLRKTQINSWYQSNLKTKMVEDVLNRKPTPKLYQFEVHGTGGSLWQENNLQANDVCNICELPKLKPPTNISVNKAYWDRSDIFTMREFPGIYLITEKFSQSLKLNNIKNYRLVNPTNRL